MTDKEKQDTKLSEDKHKEHLNEEEEEIFSTVEVKIEEMAIDGICGVY
jgi:mycofactocin precursor